MEIIYGLKNGALLQRDNDGFCKCFFRAETNGVLKTTLGTLQDKGNGEYVLTGIPSGGPYDIELYDSGDREKLTVWVGDLWILAGQSNMEGAGRVTEKVDKETESAKEHIRCYYLDARWDKAVPVTHDPWNSPDECIGGFWRKERLGSRWGSEAPDRCGEKKVMMRAVGPGYYFAKRMYEITNVPQAVIPCALGGSSLNDWEKQADKLYSVMLRRFRETGGFVRGVFWDQGESEAYAENDFTGRMIKFIADIRADMNDETLPFVQVQIAKSSIAELCEDPEIGIQWSGIKDEQRRLERKVPYLVTVSAADADFDDLIHYSSDFQEKMGIRAANAMSDIIGGGGAPVPVPYKITYRKNEEYTPFCFIFDIHYKNVGSLMSQGAPSGFMVLKKGTDIKRIFSPSTGVQKIELNGNVVSLYTEISEDPETAQIYYGFGHMAYCNITTDTGYSIPAMGPVTAEEV